MERTACCEDLTHTYTHRTRYHANAPGDLPVLTRFFPAEAVRHLTPKAKFL